MEFKFSNQDLTASQKIPQRFFEILPAALSWGILTVVFIFSFTRPLTAAIITIAFGFYLFLRLLYMNVAFRLMLSRLQIESKTNWLVRAKGLSNIYSYWKGLNEAVGAAKGKEDLSLMVHRKELRILEKSKQKIPALDDIYHLAIIPVGPGDENLAERTIASLAEGNFPAIKILAILALGKEIAKDSPRIKRIVENQRGKFFDFLSVAYPSEFYSDKSQRAIIINQAAQRGASYFKHKQIAYEKVIVSCFEPGAVINPDYCSCLSYRYLVAPDRKMSCFQPVSVYDSSVYDSSVSKRILTGASSFFQLTESINFDNLVNFSSYSLGLATLVELNYWPGDLNSADLAIFWKAYLYFNGAFGVKPLYIAYPLNLKPGLSFSEAVLKLYQARRSQALDGENFSVLMRAFLKPSRLAFIKRLGYFVRFIEAQVFGSIWPFLLLVIGWLPALFSGREFSDSGIYYSAPRITFVIFALMAACLVLSVILTNSLFPKRRSQFNFSDQVARLLALIFLVPLGIFLSAAANLEAQTCLMFGRQERDITKI